MQNIRSLIIIGIAVLFAGNVSANVDSANESDYLYNGITYMSMQSETGAWMDTVWALEVESTSNNLFDLVLSPASKRISVKVLTAFDTQEWVSVWNAKLQALDASSGLDKGDYSQSFEEIANHLPAQLQENDQFSIESSNASVTISLNGETLAIIEANNQFGFWMSAWMSASKADIYADGDMLAKGNIDTYLVDLLVQAAPDLEPAMMTAGY